MLLPTAAFETGPELAKDVESKIGAHGNAKTNRTVSRGGGAAWLPCARDESRPGSAANARKGERLVATIMPREQGVYYSVLGSPKETSLTGDEVAIVLMQRSR